MCARQAFLVSKFCGVSQTSENLREEALFQVLGVGLAQVLAHFSFADMNGFRHG